MDTITDADITPEPWQLWELDENHGELTEEGSPVVWGKGGG